MKSTLLLLLCSSVLYAQSTRKVQWSLKGGVGYYRNAASYIDLKESIIDTKVFDVYNFKPYVGRFYTIGIGAKYKRFTAEIEYCKPRFETTVDSKWTSGKETYYFPNLTFGYRKVVFLSLRAGYIFSFFKGKIDVIPNIGIGYSNYEFQLRNTSNVTVSNKPSTNNNQINIQAGAELDFKLFQDDIYNFYLSFLVNRNTRYLYSTNYSEESHNLKFNIKNGGHYAYLTLGYKLNL